MPSNHDDWSTFGARVSWLFARDSRPKKDVAAIVELPPPRISDWQKATNPEFDTLQLVVRAFPGASVAWLVTGEGDPFHEGEDASRALGEIRQILDRATSGGGAPPGPEGEEEGQERQA